MTAVGSSVPSVDCVPVSVSGSPQLVVDAVCRVAHERGFRVRGPADTEPPTVAVLIDPEGPHWDAVDTVAVPVVVLVSVAVGADDLLDLVVRGAEAVLPIDCESDELFAVVTSVAAGGPGLTAAQVRMLTVGVRKLAGAGPPVRVELTARERDILDAIDEGLSVKQVARALSISPRTVENTRRVLYRKLTAKNRSQAIARAYELGLLSEARDV